MFFSEKQHKVEKQRLFFCPRAPERRVYAVSAASLCPAIPPRLDKHSSFFNSHIDNGS